MNFVWVFSLFLKTSNKLRSKFSLFFRNFRVFSGIFPIDVDQIRLKHQFQCLKNLTQGFFKYHFRASHFKILLMEILQRCQDVTCSKSFHGNLSNISGHKISKYYSWIFSNISGSNVWTFIYPWIFSQISGLKFQNLIHGTSSQKYQDITCSKSFYGTFSTIGGENQSLTHGKLPKENQEVKFANLYRCHFKRYLPEKGVQVLWTIYCKMIHSNTSCGHEANW